MFNKIRKYIGPVHDWRSKYPFSSSYRCSRHRDFICFSGQCGSLDSDRKVILMVVCRKWLGYLSDMELDYWAIQRSWFARVNALSNLSRKKSREVAAHFRADF